MNTTCRPFILPARAWASGLMLGAALIGSQARSEVLRVAIADIAPYAMTDSEGRAIGQYPQLVNLIASRVDMQPQIRIVSCTQMKALVESGQVDMAVSMDSSALRRVSRPLAAIAVVDTVVVARASKAAELPEQAPGFALGRLKGGCMGSPQQDEAAHSDVDVDSLNEGVRLLAAKRIDGLATTPEAFYHYANLNNLPASQFGPMVPAGRQVVWVYASPKLAAGTATALSKAIQTLRQEKQQQAARQLVPQKVAQVAIQASPPLAVR